MHGFVPHTILGTFILCGEPWKITCGSYQSRGSKIPTSISTDHEKDETASWFDWEMAKMGYIRIRTGNWIVYWIHGILNSQQQEGSQRVVMMVEEDWQKVRRARPRHRSEMKQLKFTVA